MNLLVAGVDLRVRVDNTWVCFEVNPSPGFTWYEESTNHEIAEAIADLLVAGS
jgi:D-alanine-D-alanine ligase-like ATP-grasp enzyme